MRDYFAGMLVGSVLGAAAAIFYFNEEKEIKSGVKSGVRRVVAKSNQAGRFVSNVDGEPGNIIRR